MYRPDEVANAYEQLAERDDIPPEQAERFRARAAKLRQLARSRNHNREG